MSGHSPVLNTLEAESEHMGLVDVPTTKTIHLEFTSRCDLRCVYCSVSGPNYVGQDLSFPKNFDQFVKEMKARNIQEVLINGHGETLILNNWRSYCHKLLEAGFSISLISNFARELSPEDYDTLARLSNIQISCDTIDLKLFRKIRRGGDFRTLVYNMGRVRAAAAKNGHGVPSFSWSCVVSDQNVLDLDTYVSMGIGLGVRQFTFCNLVKYSDIPGDFTVNHLCEMPKEQFFQALQKLERALSLIRSFGRDCELQDGLLQSIQNRVNKENLKTEHGSTRNDGQNSQEWKESLPSGATRYSMSPADGQTRDCLDPWTFALVKSSGEVEPCCWHTSVGSLSSGQTLHEILNGQKIQTIRKNLLTGNLDERCRTCPARPLTDINVLQGKVKRHVDQYVTLEKAS